MIPFAADSQSSPPKKRHIKRGVHYIPQRPNLRIRPLFYHRNGLSRVACTNLLYGMRTFHNAEALLLKGSTTFAHEMNTDARHSRWLQHMIAAMLYVVLYCTCVQATETTSTVYGVHDTPCASLNVKDNVIFDVMHGMGQWGLPATSASLQGTMIRTSIPGQTAHRTTRLSSMILGGTPPCIPRLSDMQSHAISARRFRTGYYIYYRCQMRC